MKINKQNWKKYTIEFLSIFIAVISAFALNNWNDNRRDNTAETKILSEILNGLIKDSEDVKLNVTGHQQGIKSVIYWKDVINGKSFNTDSLAQHYYMLTRDFISLQNTSGYETLKSRGFELIKNDSLRSEIISLYEFDYQTLKKLEEDYPEAQFHSSYFKQINETITPNFIFDPKGNIIDINLPLDISESDKKILLINLWKIYVNRTFILKMYGEVEKNIESLKKKIRTELNQ
ncbi:hypothetical protein OO013_05770 [Mangrovivirga sp. M17]|uniref:Uncharacterized protein n=1 Tax=Mangrovivirga halotolerans TaxID=2993936 RepID=A0ABT3RNH7_9BACT|nr:hypothetical protein [Mangrovivirga halotolerans]MCX2743363.1 hypothetical protein [Mangrovivirga halotolerans]